QVSSTESSRDRSSSGRAAVLCAQQPGSGPLVQSSAQREPVANVIRARADADMTVRAPERTRSAPASTASSLADYFQPKKQTSSSLYNAKNRAIDAQRA